MISKNYYDSNIRAEKIILKVIKNSASRILDYGCGEGRFTDALTTKRNTVYGCDIDKSRIATAKKKCKHAHFQVIKSNKKTHYAKNFFDVVILLGVLEHVRDERSTVSEIYRIMKPGGRLYIYGINKGFFGFLDSANLKFVAPTLHKYLYQIIYGKESYFKEFSNKQSGEMFGDFSYGKIGHSHYSKKDLEDIIKNRFIIRKIWYYGIFEPILRILEFAYSVIWKKRSKFLWNLIVKDSKYSWGAKSYSFLIECIKI